MRGRAKSGSSGGRQMMRMGMRRRKETNHLGAPKGGRPRSSQPSPGRGPPGVRRFEKVYCTLHLDNSSCQFGEVLTPRGGQQLPPHPLHPNLPV